MWYRFEAWIPNSGTEPNPVRYEVRLPAGVIKRVRVRFQSGPNYKVYVRILLGTHQMWPRGPPLLPERADLPPKEFPQYWFRGEDEVIEWEEHVPTQAGDHWFLEIFADECYYDHTVAVGFNVLEAEYARPMDPIRELVGTLKRLIGL